MSDSDDVLHWWLDPEPTNESEIEERKRFWFGGDGEVDRQIRERFGTLVARARAGELDGWAETPRGTLALIVLIDQFSRNLYRGAPEAFAADPKALALARAGYDAGRFDTLGSIEHLFAAMPFRHAEDTETQKRGVALAVRHALDSPAHLRALHIYSVDWARKHLDVIVRFGRFPHRNAALGRDSSPEEVEYLAYLRAAGQWL